MVLKHRNRKLTKRSSVLVVYMFLIWFWNTFVLRNWSISSTFSSVLGCRFSKCVQIIPWISLVPVGISHFITNCIHTCFFCFILVSLAKCLSILFYFSRNRLLFSFVLCVIYVHFINFPPVLHHFFPSTHLRSGLFLSPKVLKMYLLIFFLLVKLMYQVLCFHSTWGILKFIFWFLQ